MMFAAELAAIGPVPPSVLATGPVPVRWFTVEFWGDRGTVFFEAAGNGRRKFEQVNVRRMRSKANKILQYLGAVLAVCGALTLVVGWRMREATAGMEKPVN